jgi:hypothetical protein
MAGDKKNTKRKASIKKETFQQLNSQLTGTLVWLKELLGDKKFESRIKKASKLLSSGIKSKASKKVKSGKKNVAKENPESGQQAPEQL